MKKFVQTITFGLVFSLFFATMGFSQFQVTESNGEAVNLKGDKAEEWIHWDDGTMANSVGVGEESVWHGFIRFETTDLAAYDGMELTKVRTSFNDEPSTAAVVVWTGAEGDFTEVVNQEIIPSQEAWVEVTLEEPVIIDASVELWIGIAVGDPGDGFFPLGVDATTDADGKGNLATFDVGENFDLLSGYGIAGDWNIQALVVGEGTYHEMTFVVEMTDTETTDGVAFDVEAHDVYISAEDWPSPGTDVNYKLEMVTDGEKSDVILYENFNAETLPDGWENLDEDGDGNSWFLVPADFGVIDGDHAIASASWDADAGPLTPDNWLITPQITGVGENYILSFYRKAQDPDWPAENYDVLISTTGTSATDFTSVYNETLSDGEWEEVIISLADFAGEDIYIAFRHHGVTDQFVIVLDAISVIDFVAPTEYFYSVTLNVEEGEREYKYYLVEKESDPIVDYPEWEDDEHAYRKITVTEPATIEGDVFGVPPVSVPSIVSQDGITAYPNPAREDMNIVSDSQINELRVFDLSGRLVFSQKCNTKHAVINVNSLNEGLYIMQIATENGTNNMKFSVIK